jgi:hypothetical protein
MRERNWPPKCLAGGFVAILLLILAACDSSSDPFHPAELEESAQPSAKPLEPACDALTAAGAAELLGAADSTGIYISDDVGDMCIYAAPDGAEVVFELMAPFGRQLFEIQRSEQGDTIGSDDVGEDAFLIQDEDETTLVAYQANVFLRLTVRGALDDQARARLERFGQSALTGY